MQILFWKCCAKEVYSLQTVVEKDTLYTKGSWTSSQLGQLQIDTLLRAILVTS